MDTGLVVIMNKMLNMSTVEECCVPPETVHQLTSKMLLMFNTQVQSSKKVKFPVRTTHLSCSCFLARVQSSSKKVKFSVGATPLSCSCSLAHVWSSNKKVKFSVNATPLAVPISLWISSALCGC